jgi:hypothetical protein
MKIITVLMSASLASPCVAMGGGDPAELGAEDGTVPVNTSARTVASQIQSGAGSAENTDARYIQFYTSDKTVQFQYQKHESSFNLGNSRSNASFVLSEERDTVMSATLLFDAPSVPVPGLTFSFGAKVIAGLLAVEDTDVLGIAPSIELVLRSPLEKLPLTVVAAVNYAPDILTFGNADRIFDWNVRVGLPLTRKIEGFVGYRFLQFNTLPGDRRVDNSVNLGIVWKLDS